eukprot:CAMPEP_0195100958 /NCGR_PEP_ID=MMETSP0448-20130528/64831_1 /TAXON_ID=66468 /ORGANISM="Heterocapsa triquestra, Strain CCMP 448" /LENGTH=239 /DNA_ID=CAMNT_0040136195 /DNA_START=61 /DNA_END=780 /DNA_ORIENTATION=+
MAAAAFNALPDVSSVGRHQLVVKRTFLEFVGDGLDELTMRKVQTSPARSYEGGLSDVETASGAGDSDLDSPSHDGAKPTPMEEPQSPAATQVQQAMPPTDDRTTIMLRNLPNNYTRDMFLEMLDAEGFDGRYDFVYLPIDFKTKAGVGYAFVNAVDNATAQELWTTFEGYNKWVLPTSKKCYVSWSNPNLQGARKNVQRWRNSSVMHGGVPDEYKPCIFKDGVRAKFPRASRALKPPRF